MALIVVIALVKIFTGGSGQQVSLLDSTDTVAEFYDQWLEAARNPATADPSLATLADSSLLSKALKTKIANAQSNSETTIDPVLCQASIPAAISIRNVYENEGQVQILVTEKGKSSANQAIVTLNKQKNGWFINDIECSSGEVPPEREFSFEKVGFLLKSSVPNPYNPKNWHLVFEDNGNAGNVVPLIFDSESQCTSLDGKKSVCTPDTFSETMKVSIQAQMTERGATVKKLEFVK